MPRGTPAAGAIGSASFPPLVREVCSRRRRNCTGRQRGDCSTWPGAPRPSLRWPRPLLLHLAPLSALGLVIRGCVFSLGSPSATTRPRLPLGNARAGSSSIAACCSGAGSSSTAACCSSPSMYGCRYVRSTNFPCRKANSTLSSPAAPARSPRGVEMIVALGADTTHRRRAARVSKGWG